LKGAIVAQGEFVEYARNTMPAPVEDPGSFPLWSAIPGFAKEAGDWQLAEARQSAFQEQAVHVMETYQNNTEQNKPHIQAFAAPTSVTTPSELPGVPVPPDVLGVPGTGPGAGVGATVGAAAAGAAGAGVPGSGGGGVAVPPVVVGGGAVPAPPGQNRPGGGGAGGRVPPQTTLPGAGRVPQVPGSAGVPPESVPGGGRIPAGGAGGPGGAGTPSSRGLPGGAGGVEPRSPRGGVPGGYGGVEPRTGIPGGIPAEGETARPGVASSTPAGSTGARTAGSHGFFPPGGGGGLGGQGREHRRAPYLVDDTDAFGDDRYFTPAVITEADYVPRRT
jgi:hypothetical protein